MARSTHDSEKEDKGRHYKESDKKLLSEVPLVFYFLT